MDVRDQLNCSALDHPASEGHEDVIRELLHHGTHVMSRRPDGSTALHVDVNHNQAGAVDVLVEAGANVEALGEFAETSPIYAAAGGGSCDAMVALLRHKADSNAHDGLGWRPFHRAYSQLHQKAANLLLLRWGADETSVDNDGRSANEVVGISIDEDDQQDTSPENAENIRRLLACAPADRA